MKLVIMILLTLFSAIVPICTMAETYTEKIGPFIINASSDEPVSFTVYSALPIDNCNPHDIDMNVGSNVTYRLEIQDYSKPINIVENNLMSAILSFNSVSSEYYTSWELLKVGSKLGIIGTIGQGEVENGYPVHGCVAAYSPDGIGIRGTIIAIISFNTDKNNFEQDKAKFEAFVKNLRIFKTG